MVIEQDQLEALASDFCRDLFTAHLASYPEEILTQVPVRVTDLPCSLELISTVYQPLYSVFLSQQISKQYFSASA
jgi:hypothetical protein